MKATIGAFFGGLSYRETVILNDSEHRSESNGSVFSVTSCSFGIRFDGHPIEKMPSAREDSRPPVPQMGVRDKQLRFLRCLLFLWPSLCIFFAANIPRAMSWTLSEDFSRDPAGDGWLTAGDSSLFSWNPGEAALDVTWDSARPNSYYYRPLGMTISREDCFQLEFDLTMDQISAGTDPDRPFTFELAIGLLNLESATDPGFARGTGNSSPNLLEFDYFPGAETITPTFAFTIISSNNIFLYSHNFPLTLDPGALFHFQMQYSSANQILRSVVTRNGEPFAPMEPIALKTGFTGFALDALAISSYSDEGADGSILARGTVDNVRFALLRPFEITAQGGSKDFLTEFLTDSGWRYSLERTEDFLAWRLIAGPSDGTGRPMTLADPDPAPPRAAFYRVRAECP